MTHIGPVLARCWPGAALVLPRCCPACAAPVNHDFSFSPIDPDALPYILSRTLLCQSISGNMCL